MVGLILVIPFVGSNCPWFLVTLIGSIILCFLGFVHLESLGLHGELGGVHNVLNLGIGGEHLEIFLWILGALVCIADCKDHHASANPIRKQISVLIHSTFAVRRGKIGIYTLQTP